MDDLGTSVSPASELPGSNAPLARSPRNSLFFNERGLRAGWRLLLYILLVVLFSAALTAIVQKIHPPTRGLSSPRATLLQEILGFAVVFGCALIMSRIERRDPGVRHASGSGGGFSSDGLDRRVRGLLVWKFGFIRP